MRNTDPGTVALCARVPRELVAALDEAAAVLRRETGLPCTRTGALVVALRRALAGRLDGPGATPTEAPVVDEDDLRRRAKALAQRARGSAVAARLGAHVGLAGRSVRDWWQGASAWPPATLAKAATWLDRQGA